MTASTIEFGRPGISPEDLPNVQARIDLDLPYKDPDAPTTAERVRRARNALLRLDETPTPSGELVPLMEYGLSEFTRLGGAACKEVAAKIVDAVAQRATGTEQRAFTLDNEARAHLAGILTRSALSTDSSLDTTEQGILHTTLGHDLPLLTDGTHAQYLEGLGPIAAKV